MIKRLDDNVYKIGISKNPKKRLNTLQTGSSSKLELVEQFETSYYNKVEKALHNFNKHSNVGGEWFELYLEDELNFITNCQKIENNLIFLEKNKI